MANTSFRKTRNYQVSSRIFDLDGADRQQQSYLRLLLTIMGNKSSKKQEKASNSRNEVAKVVGLHGWRTSGSILSMQTSALRYHTKLDILAPDALWKAEGPPDPGIAQFYPNLSYFEWFYRRDSTIVGLPESLDFIIQKLATVNNAEGMLGFSQGAGMVAKTLQHIRKMQQSLPPHVKFVILIAGVEPVNTGSEDEEPLDIPSLHLIGTQDSLMPRSKKLLEHFREEKRTVLYHNEGHNVPSMRTGLYPEIAAWIASYR